MMPVTSGDLAARDGEASNTFLYPAVREGPTAYDLVPKCSESWVSEQTAAIVNSRRCFFFLFFLPYHLFKVHYTFHYMNEK